MEANKALDYMTRMRAEFREVLNENENRIKDFLQKALEGCCGNFDEQCLMENLKEEFDLVQKELDEN